MAECVKKTYKIKVEKMEHKNNKKPFYDIKAVPDKKYTQFATCF